MSNTPNESEYPRGSTLDGNVSDQLSINCASSIQGPTAPSGTNVESFQTENEGAKMNGSPQSTQGDGGDSICRDFTASYVSSNGSAPLALTDDEDPFELLAGNNFVFAPDCLYEYESDHTAEEIWESWKALVKDIHEQYEKYQFKGKHIGCVSTSAQHFGHYITVELARSQGRSSLCFKLDFDKEHTLQAPEKVGATEYYDVLHEPAFGHRLSEAGTISGSAKEALGRIGRVKYRDTFRTSQTGYSGWLLRRLVSQLGTKQQMRSYWYYGMIDSRPPPAD